MRFDCDKLSENDPFRLTLAIFVLWLSWIMNRGPPWAVTSRRSAPGLRKPFGQNMTRGRCVTCSPTPSHVLKIFNIHVSKRLS